MCTFPSLQVALGMAGVLAGYRKVLLAFVPQGAPSRTGQDAHLCRPATVLLRAFARLSPFLCPSHSLSHLFRSLSVSPCFSVLLLMLPRSLRLPPLGFSLPYLLMQPDELRVHVCGSVSPPPLENKPGVSECQPALFTVQPPKPVVTAQCSCPSLRSGFWR